MILVPHTVGIPDYYQLRMLISCQYVSMLAVFIHLIDIKVEYTL